MWGTTSATAGNWIEQLQRRHLHLGQPGIAGRLRQHQQQANRAITLGGTVIAHGLTFTAGGTGYSFSSGSLTVTAGGIQANENVTFNSVMYIGGPQSWTVASGKTLTVNGALHTIISDLTFDGAGNTVITGTIDGGGVMNTAGGAAPGGLIQAGSGTVTLSGTPNFAGNITVNSGAGPLNISPAGGASATYSGGWFGGGTVNVNCAGTLSLGGGASNFTGVLNMLQPGTLQFVPAAGVTSTFGGTINGGGSIVQNGPGTTILTEHEQLHRRHHYQQRRLAGRFRRRASRPTSFLSLDGGVLQSNRAARRISPAAWAPPGRPSSGRPTAAASPPAAGRWSSTSATATPTARLGHNRRQPDRGNA